MSELFNTAIVEKRNVLNELRSNNMTLQELRFFSIYLSKINPYDVSTRNVRFPIEEFQRIMGFGKLNLGQIRASTDSLLCKIVHVPDENGRGMRAFQLFKECHIFQDEDGRWYMEIDAHDRALSLMFDFKNRYFKYELWNALRLKSPNQLRMYEILKQYEGLGKRELTITELRELLGIGVNEYSDRTGWSNFKKYVLDSCQQALKESTDICYTYERGRTGKGGKWLTIVFHIFKNEDYKDPLSLKEFIARQPEPNPLALGTMSADDELVGQTSLSEAPAEPQNALAKAVDNEFDEETMRLIAEKIKNKGIPDSKAPSFLREMWLMLLIEEKRKEDQGLKILDKAKYLIAMIDRRTPPKADKRRTAYEETSTIDDNKWYELADSFDPWEELENWK